MGNSKIWIISASLATFALLSFETKKDRVLLFEKQLHSTKILSYDSIPITEPVSFEFENSSTTNPVTFWFKSATGVDYRNASTMLESVISDTMTNSEKAIAIWKLVAFSGFHEMFAYNSSLKDNINPLALVRFPYFACGEKAGIMVTLANFACMDARVVSMQGHVVAELFYDGRWHMFDADENCIYRNPQGEVASIEDLRNHPEWLNANQVERLIKNNFSGFSAYRSYMKSVEYIPGDTLCALPRFYYNDASITLFPQDKVMFTLSPTSRLVRMKNERYIHYTKGLLIRRLDLLHNNLRIVNDSTITYNRDFPYYITSLRICADAYMKADVYLVYENRETHQTVREYLGQLSEKNCVYRNIDAPASAQILYRYTILFEGIRRNQIDNVVLEQEFDFNSVTFPLHRAGDKLILTEESADETTLSFQIIKGERNKPKR